MKERKSRIARLRTSPGEILMEEFLKPNRVTAHGLALALRVPANRVTAIVNGKRGISADTALRLGRYFGTTAQFWLNAQSAFDLSKVEMDVGRRIERDIRPLAA